MKSAWIVDAVRTPRGRGKAGKGALSGVHPQELLAQTLRALVARTGVDASAIEDVSSSESSRPRLRTFPTFSSRVGTGAGCGTDTSSNRSEVFLT